MNINGLKMMTEMPRLINTADFDSTLSNRKTNIEIVKELKLRTKRKKLFVHKGMPIYSKGDLKGSGKIYQLKEENGDVFITYYASVERVKGYKGLTGTTQTAVWRSHDTESRGGLTSKVFFDVLLPQRNVLISDSIQTLDGKRFWLDNMKEALARKHDVGVFDESKKLFEIFDEKENTDLVTWATETVKGWGYDKIFEKIRFFIRR